MLSLFRENIRIAFDSIKSQLLRTILTILIIAIGITALVAILSLVKALENTMSSNFSSMGSNTFNLQRYEYSTQRRGGGERVKVNPVIGYRQVKDFSENYEYPGTTVAMSFTGSASAEVKYENEKTDPEVTVIGANENFLVNSGLKLESGRDLNFFDVQNNNAVCILGSDFATGLLKGTNPIDKTISIRGTKFKVIGILEVKGSTFGNNQDQRVIIPIQVARSMFTRANIDYAVSVKVDSPEMMDGAQDQAVLTFRNIRKLSPVEENNFGMTRSDDLLNQIAENTAVLNKAAWIIGLITIFGSSIALMNIMLVSVTERTREIGVRKALGAKRKSIASQFLMETLMIGQLGGLLGVILGISIALGISSYIDFDFPIPWTAIIAAFTTTFAVAIISGLFPAIKASKLDPIEALRYE